MSSPVASTSRSVKGKSPARPAEKRYACTHEGCDKAYTKPARLKEHERVHTGERPFVCPTCQQSYRRDTHLNAHLRTHMSEEDKPLVCSHDNCSKRFWTQQHLRSHITACHEGGQSFDCDQCSESFAKHNLLRSHIAEAHCPPGTRPFQCEHAGCDKSFLTGSKLRTHAKTHDESRYTCGHLACASLPGGPPAFPNWTALQKHSKSEHPPVCHHPGCAGQVFASLANLRAHLSLLHKDDVESPRKRKRRTQKEKTRTTDESAGEETALDFETSAFDTDSGNRPWPCTTDGCSRAFKSANALLKHSQTSHGIGSSKVLACSQPDCDFTARKQHVLERHQKSVHCEKSQPNEPAPPVPAIDLLTGHNYLTIQAAASDMEDRPPKRRKLLDRVYPCPASQIDLMNAIVCEFAFKRHYDVQRHLKSAHNVEMDAERLRELLA